MVKAFDFSRDEYREMNSDEAQESFDRANAMCARYFILRDAIASAIKDGKRLPRGVKKLFLDQKKEIEGELLARPEYRKEMERREYIGKLVDDALRRSRLDVIRKKEEA